MKIFKFFIFAASTFVIFASCKNNQTQNSENKRPNIIYIMADDLGYGDLGSYGQEIIKTPELDQMAYEGMRFTAHYSGSPVCAPSRCVLMTGLHTGHAYVRGNQQAEPYGQLAIPAESYTVAELLKKAGYTTGLVGKWGLGVENTPGEPSNQGFDYYFGYLDQVLAHNYFPEFLIENGERIYLENEVKYLDSTEWHKGLGSYSTVQKDYSHDIFTDKALSFINENARAEDPFFLYLAYTIPHNNGEAPLDEKMEVPDFGIYTDESWTKEERGYAAMISRMDADVGQILDALREWEIDGNTLVIFTSDNGPMQEDVHSFTKKFNSNGIYRGGKRDLYEGGIRVPFIAWWPGKIAENSVSDHVSAFWDFMPTAAELAGLEKPENIDGLSYLPVLLGQEQEAHEYLYWEFPEKGYQTGIRMGKWKAVRMEMVQNPLAAFELYNLEDDPTESNNIADDYPDIIDKMQEIANKARVESEFFPMPK